VLTSLSGAIAGVCATITSSYVDSSIATLSAGGTTLTLGANGSTTGSLIFETASNTNTWTLGINGASGFQFTTTATSQTQDGITFPGQINIAANSGVAGFLAMNEGTYPTGASSVQILYPDSATHLTRIWNGVLGVDATHGYFVAETNATST